MAEKNSVLVDKVWLSGGNDYQQRVPRATQGDLSNVFNAITAPGNNDLWNIFIGGLMNRIGTTYVHQQAFKNPLAVFKGDKLLYGNTIQEIAPYWIKSHSFEDNNETLLKLNRPEAAQWFYNINRREFYPISITIDELRQAFVDEYGLNKMISAILQQPINADEYDEYLIMRQLFAEYEYRWGFFKVHLDAAPDDPATARAFLKAAKTMAGKLRFPSARYNATAQVLDNDAGIPVFADRNELVLFVTPEVNASIDVDGYAPIFHIDKAEIPFRIVEIDEFPIPGVVGALVTEDWFVCHDTVYTNTSFMNPETLTTNYYLHHQGIYAASPFVPAILFTTDEATALPEVVQTVTSLGIAADKDSVAPGGTVELTLTLNGTMTGGDQGTLEVAPDSALITITGEGADGNGIALNARTYAKNIGEHVVINVQKTGLTKGDKLKVIALSTYINPSGNTEEFKATKEITIS